MQSLKEFSEKLLSLYTGEYRGINLTRILDSDEFYHKQILDSLLPFQEMDLQGEIIDTNELILDIVSVAVFPCFHWPIISLRN